MDDVFVEIDGLVKRFGPFTAVDGLSFQVCRGEVLGFLGPNGAGKSTTMKMITGFLTPTEGRISICGNDIREDPISAQSLIGYLPEGAPAYGDMTPRQYLRFIAEVRGYRGDRITRAVHQASSRAQLGGVMDQLIDTLSKGFKRRVGLAQAILHDPPILIMDEPTDGLDPNQKFAVRRLITAMAKNKAIIISTHILEEVDSVCSRALIIDRGRIVGDGTPEQLAARSRYHNAVTVQVGARDAAAARAAFEALAPVGDIVPRRTATGATQFTLFPANPEHLLIEDVSDLVSRHDWDVSALYAEAGRLDEVFRTLTTPDAEDARRRAENGAVPKSRPDAEVRGRPAAAPAARAARTTLEAPRDRAASPETPAPPVAADVPAPSTGMPREIPPEPGAANGAAKVAAKAPKKVAAKTGSATKTPRKAAAKTKSAAKAPKKTAAKAKAATRTTKTATGTGKAGSREPSTG